MYYDNSFHYTARVSYRIFLLFTPPNLRNGPFVACISTVKESSGFTILDDSALTAVSRWRFVPAIENVAIRNGRAVTSQVLVPIRFLSKRGNIDSYPTIKR